MAVNEAAKGALDAYMKLDGPGHALLLEAPWGAGKTHFIRNALRTQENPEVRYVSLNGVEDRAAFRKALLDGLPSKALRGATEALGNVLGKMAQAGDVGSLLRNKVEERMIANLPATLVFDDFERCTIPAATLIGLLNDFVEHQGKRVILIAHSDKRADIEAFLSRKEKLVGRTLRLACDFESALPVFVEKLNDGQGKVWLQIHPAPIREVFEAAGHRNLRVLRHALQECARMLDVLEPDLIAAEDAVARLVRTFLALAMPLIVGEIRPEDLGKRGNQKVFFARDGEEKHPLSEIYERHKTHAEIASISGESILPVALGSALIGEGHASAEEINATLRGTGQFVPAAADPLWRRLCSWRNARGPDLEELVAEAEGALFRTTPIEPGPFLHIADNLLRIAACGGLRRDEDALAAEILSRISGLQAADQIPAADYGRLYGWEMRMGRFNFGGYGCEPSANFMRITKAVREAQFAAFAATLDQQAQALPDLFRTDIFAFMRAMKYHPDGRSYQDTEILHHIPGNAFAAAILEKMHNGEAEPAFTALQVAFERIQTHPSWDGEARWVEELRTALSDVAIKAGPLSHAQMRWNMQFLRWPSPE